MASGGVNLENTREFIRFGVDALGIGGALISKNNQRILALYSCSPAPVGGRPQRARRDEFGVGQLEL
jgi:hypothetical protein